MNPGYSPEASAPSSRNQPRNSSRWKKIASWFVAASAILFLLVTIVVFGFLHSARFHRFVISKVQQQASDALSVPVELQDFTLHLSNVSLDLYGITVHGASPYPDPPVLQVEHVEVGVRIVSIFRKEWYLDTLRVDRPVVKIFADSQGRTNIPTVKSSGNSSSNTSVFDLGVRHAILDGGQAFYNNQQSSLSADLQDLEFSAAFDPLSRKYSGRLGYSDGHLSSGTLQQIPHSLDARFEATPERFDLTSATLTSGSSKAIVVATLKNYGQPDVQATYEVTLDAGEFQKLLKNPSIPTGTIRAAGSAHYQQVANRAVLDTLLVKGDLSSPRLDLQTPALRAQATDLLAHYNVENGDAVLQDLRLNLFGGSLVANGKMTRFSGESRSEVEAALHGVSLRAINRAMQKSALPAGTTLDGTLNLGAKANWGKTLDDLVATADSTISAGVGSTASSNTIPINSVFHARYTAQNKQLALQKSYLRTPQTTLTLDGTMSNKSSLNVNLSARDLHEVETIAAVFTAPGANGSSQPLGLGGTADFKGTVHGSTAAPHLEGQLEGANVRIRGTEVRRLQSRVDLSPSSAGLANAQLQLAARGRINLDAHTALSNWSFTETSPLNVRLNASDLSLADLTRIAGTDVPVTGNLNADVDLHGTQLSPQGQGSVSLDNTIAYQQPIDSAKLTFAGSGDEVHGDLAVQAISGDLRSHVSLRPRAKSYTAQLAATGFHLDQLQAIKSKGLNLTGVLSANATGQGTFDNPQVDASVTIPSLLVQGQTFTNSNLHLNVTNHLANANVVSAGINSSLRAAAKVALTGDYPADASIDTQSIPLQPLLAVYAPAQAPDVTGQTELHATLHGPLKDKKRLEAHVTIPVLKVAYRDNLQLAAASPIHIDYKDNIVALQRVSIRGTETDLQMQASFPVVPNPPISALLLGSINLQLAQLFSPDIRSSGQIKFDINSYGAPSNSNIGGQINIVDAGFSTLDLPVGLQHGNGVLTLTKDRINISRFEGTVGGGVVTAQGGVSYQPAVQFDLGVAAKGIRILYPQGVREGVDANVRLTGSTENALLGGSINLSDISFTPAFDLNSFIGQFSGGITPPPSQGFSQNLQLNLAVRSTNDVNLVSRTISINGSANLQVRGTAAEPVILGRVNLNNGDVILNGERFVLNGGTIEFVNPSETQPVVNLSLYTTIQEYNVYLRFNGPIDQLRTNYSSDPALPSADIINLLAFGKTTEASAATPSQPANQAAESLIASQVSSQVTSRVSKIAGISQLSISPVLAGGTSQGPPGANITIQQRVTGNLFITFSSNVASTQNQTIQGQYQLTPRIAISGTRDQNGGFAVDSLIKKSW